MPWGTYVRAKKNTSLGYSARELAEAFGLTKDTVYRMARAKPPKLPSIRLSNGTIRFPRPAIRAMLRAGHHIKLG